MKEIVYVNKSEITTFFDTSDKSVFQGVGFGWSSEGIMHAYIHPQRFIKGGDSIAVFFKFQEELPANIDTIFFNEIFDRSDSETNKDSLSQYLGVFVFLKSGEISARAFFKTNGAIIECEVHYIPGREELYSRSNGLLETNALAHRKVLIIGLGSFGSQIAIDLAKAGIGNFSLVDFDRLELSNVSRHVCGVNELGRFKTHAIKDAILLRNPYANIETFEIDINIEEKILRQLMISADITVCVTDNNRSRFNINALALELNKVILFGRAITRAEGGDVFKQNGNSGPCYNCLVGNSAFTSITGHEEISTRKQADSTLPAYTTPEEREAMVQVGLSSDISPICNMIVKLALTELAKSTSSGLFSLEQELTYSYYLWANRRERQYTNWGPFNDSENKPTILRWYGVKIPKNISCMSCNYLKEHE